MPTPTANLPTPNFAYDPATDIRAGRRPFRRGTYRLECPPGGDKVLIHNYGHGGAGITMALGCALEVRDMVRASGKASEGTAVAVLGGGVMGLTVATLLKEMRLDVRMYAKSFTDTVSDIAGGQWSPSIVTYEETAVGKQRFERILCRAFRGYQAMINQGYGVSTQPNYVHKKTDGSREPYHARARAEPAVRWTQRIVRMEVRHPADRAAHLLGPAPARPERPKRSHEPAGILLAPADIGSRGAHRRQLHGSRLARNLDGPRTGAKARAARFPATATAPAIPL
jgi:glycine/D-amino acid oxidase-like deaminating enzyme